MNELDQLIEVISASLDQLYSKDEYLIFNKNHSRYSHVSERGIVFRFGIYFDEIIRKIYPLLNVDTEYNRNRNDLKRLLNGRNGSYPDLILHERGSNNNNIIVLEFKSWWDANQTHDKNKIELFCDSYGRYNYKHGALILLTKKREDVKIDVFSDGRWSTLE